MSRWGGFAVTLREALFGPRVTIEYPEAKRPKPTRFHGRHILNRYEDGMEKCIGCELCAGVCPAQCIYVRGADNPPENPVSPGERYGFVYEINYLRCIHCDLCVEACPTEAITETKLFEFSFRSREDAIYTKDELLVGDDGRAKRLPWEHWVGDEDERASAWVRATASSGEDAYEGRVAWSPELGFGLRPPEGPSDSDSPADRRPTEARTGRPRRRRAGATSAEPLPPEVVHEEAGPGSVRQEPGVSGVPEEPGVSGVPEDPGARGVPEDPGARGVPEDKEAR